MGVATEISWTDSTFNPWHGCQRVSPGCENCYAETFARRIGYGGSKPALWGPAAERRLFGDKHWNEPVKWNLAAAKAGRRHRVFCASMADVFEDRRDLDAQRERLWALIEATPALDWQLLTKRPQNMTRLAPARWSESWPSHVWAGTSTEDNKRAEERIPFLRRVPCETLFISAEPLLGPIKPNLSFLSWAIIGGESGPGARPCDVNWVRALVADCRRWGTAAFVKQLGDASVWPLAEAARGVFRGGRLRLKPKGGDISEFPADLRVRMFPGEAWA